MLGQCDDQRRFASAAHHNVAHHDERHSTAFSIDKPDAVEPAMKERDPAIQQRQGPQQTSRQTPLAPGPGKPGAHGCHCLPASGLRGALGGESYLRKTVAARSFHHRDHCLVRAAGVSTDDDHAVFARFGSKHQRRAKTFNAAAFNQGFVDHVAPVVADSNNNFFGIVPLLLSIRQRELDLQLGELAVGG